MKGESGIRNEGKVHSDLPVCGIAYLFCMHLQNACSKDRLVPRSALFEDRR